MRETKTFKTNESLQKWIKKNGKKYQRFEIIVNNAYGVECKKLLSIVF